MVAIFKQRGFRVAAIKHAAHGYDMDVPGKDSWLHYQAGADQVVLAGAESISMHQRCLKPPVLIDALSLIREVDIILVEGFKTEPGPKIEIIRRDKMNERIVASSELLAIVSDAAPRSDAPVFEYEQLNSWQIFLLDTLT
jgi:molybdopterin-guanine dinucleotide biosynthesis protein MobB